jgi:hypothetical protein
MVVSPLGGLRSLEAMRREGAFVGMSGMCIRLGGMRRNKYKNVTWPTKKFNTVILGKPVFLLLPEGHIESKVRHCPV